MISTIFVQQLMISIPKKMKDSNALIKEIRLDILKMINKGSSSHIGSALSCVDLLVALYTQYLNVDPNNPEDPNRDKFILSKGHGCLALYLLLADKGFFPEHELFTACSFGSRLGGHPEYGLPGIEAATGALGHGLSIGVGMALAARIDQRKSRVFVVVGDGESQEGSIWEAAMGASKHQLDNLVVLVDRVFKDLGLNP